MALVGGGGAGNVAGGNPAGVGTSLNYIGDHAYAYSGNITTSGTSALTMLDFTTGNEYIVAIVEWGYDAVTNIDVKVDALINTEKVFSVELNVPDYTGTPVVAHLIIPPYSRFQATALGNNSPFTVTLTGRIYA